MKHPTLQEERKLWKKGYKKVVGIDEVGRGPLAGPVVAAAVSVIGNWKLEIGNLKVNDSKQLTSKTREKLYEILTTHPGVEWGIGKVSEKVIDRINILEATKLAMQKAVKNLESKLMDVGLPLNLRGVRHHEIDFLILDGNFKIKSTIPQKSVIRGDEKVFSCSCASIIAKVTRDKLMRQYDKKYPYYNFASNKGYPTKYHRAMLNKYGRCGIHRNSFHYAIT